MRTGSARPRARLGAAVYCINESVKYARERKPFGKALAENQAIQWPLVELATQAEMLRLLIRKTAWEMDQLTQAQVEHTLSTGCRCVIFGPIACAARPRPRHAGPWRHGLTHGTSRSNTSTATTAATAFTEGSEEIQKRKVAGFLFGYMGAGKH